MSSAKYELSALGRSLLPPLRALERWAIDNIADVLTAREGYDHAVSQE